MPRSRTRCLQALLFAVALVSAITPAASARAAPTTPARSAAPAKATRDVDYQIRHRRDDDPARASGAWEWTRTEVRNDGSLTDRGEGYAALSFQHSLADGTVVRRGFNAEDERIPTDYIVTGDVREITVFLCKAGGAKAGVGIPTTCATETFTRGGRR